MPSRNRSQLSLESWTATIVQPSDDTPAAKSVYRICTLKRWGVHQRATTPRPRVQGRISQAAHSNERWATDLTHCGQDGWAHLAAVIDCHDRELIGHELALRGLAKEAERALEEACLERFGTLRPEGATPNLPPTTA